MPARFISELLLKKNPLPERAQDLLQRQALRGTEGLGKRRLDLSHHPRTCLGLLASQFRQLCPFTPPIGGVILMDQYLLRKGSVIDRDWRLLPFIAWACGSVVGLLVEFNAPQYSTAISSFLVGSVVYLIITKVAGKNA